MGISDTLLGRKNVDGYPFIDAIEPSAALPGGGDRSVCEPLNPPQRARPELPVTQVRGPIVLSSAYCVNPRVRSGPQPGQMTSQPNGPSNNAGGVKSAQPRPE